MHAGKTKADPPTVTCNQTACPSGFLACSGFCLQPFIASMASSMGLKTADLCAAFAKASGGQGSCSSASGATCTAGAAVCQAPAPLECATGLVSHG